jgi:tetratricopeptide (TPR) repeat protein
LIEVKSGKAMWGFRYGRPVSELVALQNQLANEISDKLKINPQKSVAAKSYTENSEAFEFYLKGEYHRQKATPDDTRKSIEFYQKAVALDSNYALGYQGLALAYRLAPAYGTHTPQEAYPKAKEAAMQALAIDPTLGSAHIPLASIKFVYDWDFAGAESEYQQAIRYAPNNPEAHYSYGNFLVAMGRFDEAINELKIAQQFEPLSPSIASNIAWALYVAGRFNEAETQIKQVLEREPNFPRAYISLGEIYVEQGKFEDAINAYQKAGQRTDDPINLMALGHAQAAAGRKTEALKTAQELEARVLKKEVSPFLPAVIYAGLNDKDKAFYWLERAFQERSNWLTLTKVGHRLKNLHGDPRFDDLLKRIGFDK